MPSPLGNNSLIYWRAKLLACCSQQRSRVAGLLQPAEGQSRQRSRRTVRSWQPAVAPGKRRLVVDPAEGKQRASAPQAEHGQSLILPLKLDKGVFSLVI